MIYDIKHNNQRDNENFKGLFPGSWQCFTTSNWTRMSHYTKEIDATDDIGLSKYLDDIEISIGETGLGEEIAKHNSIKKWSSIHWAVQSAGVTKWLNKFGVSGHDVFVNMKYSDIQEFIWKFPITVGTEKIGGLPGGHVILCIGIDDTTGDLIFNDPYGDANMNYSETNGERVSYSEKLLTQNRDFFRVAYWEA